jgi:carbon-monoxide dehydrogenase large subunit
VSWVGRATPRREDARFLAGQGRFVADLGGPGTLHAVFVRATQPRARLLKVEVEEARHQRGVVAVHTGAELAADAGPLPTLHEPHPGFAAATGFRMADAQLPCLAAAEVHYVGQPVAVVIAESRHLAEDAAELVDVRYEELPAVMTLEQALAPGAPRLHDAWPDNKIVSALREDAEVAKILASAPRVVRGSYKVQRQAPSPLETRGAVADYRGGRLTLWTSTQSPHIVRTTLSQMLALPEASIRVVAQDLGGAFGAKTHVYPEEVLVCWLARRLGRPVRWIEDRAEHMVSTVHARDQLHELEAAVGDDGAILALRANIVCDVGSGEIFIPSLATSFVTAAIITGPYRIPHAEVGVDCVVTNKTPSGAYRGFGAPEAVFALERFVERVAREAGRDSIELRREMILAPEDLPYVLPSGAVVDSGSHREAFERAVELGRSELELAVAAHGAEEHSRVGLGIATYIEGGGPSYYVTTGYWTSHEPCVARVEPDGGVVVSVGVTGMGQGLQTAVATIASDALGVPADTVRVVMGDTDTAPYGLGSWGSRGTIVAAGAVTKTMASLRDKVLRVAAHLLEASAEDLVLEAGHIHVQGSAGRSVSLAEVATVATIRTVDLPPDIDAGLDASETYDAPNVMHAPDEHGRMNAVAAQANATHAAVVKVDVATGQVEILRYFVVHDPGTIVNRGIVDGQIRGGVAQGIGGTLYEHVSYSPDGQPLTTSFMDYLLPGGHEVPEVVIEHFDNPSPVTALGVKGVGESGPIGPPAAIANAVASALAEYGADPTSTPVMPSDVRAMIRGAAS